MVDAVKMSRAVRAVEERNTVEVAKLIAKAMAFDATMSGDNKELVEHCVALANIYENLHDKLRYWMLALDTAKKEPSIFLETCFFISKEIEGLPDYRIPVAYSLLESMGQKEFITIVNSVVAATKTGKKTTRKYTKKSPKDDTGTMGDYNVWMYPESSSIYKYKYSPKSRTLHMVFNSNPQEYSYYDVSPELFRSLQNAESKGRFFAANIKVQHSENHK